MAALSGEELVEFQRLAYGFAQATGETVHFGVRPWDKGWFAHVAGIEYDGSDPLMALRSVIDGWTQNAETEARIAENQSKALRAALLAIPKEKATA